MVGRKNDSCAWQTRPANNTGRAEQDTPPAWHSLDGKVRSAEQRNDDFFILAGDAPHLDGTFAAFGRVTKGIDVVDKINKAPVTDEKPDKPVRITKASVIPCMASTGR